MKWSSPEWLDTARSWLDERLAEVGAARTGEVTQPHLRPWATVVTAPTTVGPVWLKAPGPENAFEVALYGLLTTTSPTRILTPIAVDVDRGWVLLPDGGRTLGEQLGDRIGGTDLADALVAFLPQYAQLQRELMPHADDMLAFGMTDMRAEIMPLRFEEAVDVVGAYVAEHDDEGGRETLRRVTAMRAEYGEWCARLAEAVVPASLDHNDLHPWNVFMTDGRATFYDWGDGVVAHPFSSMYLVLGIVHHKLGVPVDDPAVVRPRDAYLEVFGDLAPRAELVAELELACWVAKITRVLTWARSLRQLDYDEAREFASAPLESLAGLLGPTWADLRLDS
jgi:hypothetical protein